MESMIKQTKENLVLVDKADNSIGVGEKIMSHIEGKLHRAFSILIFNSKGELLIQQRAKSKYHCPGIWANTCCSHPRPNEDIYSAAHRRLIEEMGFDCKIRKLFKFHYCAKFDNGLSENEIDYVFMGLYDGEPNPNKEEVMDFKWISFEKLSSDFVKKPDNYAIWFKIILDKILSSKNYYKLKSVYLKNGA